VAAAAIGQHLGKLCLEAGLVGDQGLGGRGILAELRESGVEIVLVLPDGRERLGFLPRLAVVGKQRGQLPRRIDVDVERGLHGLRIVGRGPLQHIGRRLGRGSHGFVDGLARFDDLDVLGQGGRGTDRHTGNQDDASRHGSSIGGCRPA